MTDSSDPIALRSPSRDLYTEPACDPATLAQLVAFRRALDAAALRRFDFKLHFRPLAPAQRLALFAREALGSAEAVDAIPPLLVRKLHSLELLTPGDFANVVRQRTLLGEALAPEDFLRRLIAECRWKEGVGRSSAVA